MDIKYQYNNSGVVLKFSRTLLAIQSDIYATENNAKYYAIGLQNVVSMVVMNENNTLFSLQSGQDIVPPCLNFLIFIQLV